MVPLALGSQTLGSTVRPSSYCGIYGFKPTFGMLPRTGMLKTTDTLDHVALMTRSIEDTRLFFETTRLSGDNHPFINARVDKRIATSSVDRKWRVGVLVPPSWAQEEPYAAAALARFSAKLSEAGSQVRRIHLPPDFEEVPRIHDTIYDVMLSYYFKEEYNDHLDEISDWFAEMVERGLAISTDNYVAALRRQEDLERQFEDTLARQDVPADPVIVRRSTRGSVLPYPPRYVHGLDALQGPCPERPRIQRSLRVAVRPAGRRQALR